MLFKELSPGLISMTVAEKFILIPVRLSNWILPVKEPDSSSKTIYRKKVDLLYEPYFYQSNQQALNKSISANFL